MILLIVRTHQECQHHIYFIKPVPNPKNIQQVQTDIFASIPTNQHNQVVMAICSSNDNIKRNDDYQEVNSINDLVKALDDPDRFNQNLAYRVKNNSHLQKIRHR